MTHMKSSSPVLLVWTLAAGVMLGLGACSCSDPPPAQAATQSPPPAPVTPAAAPPAVEVNPALPPEIAARLVRPHSPIIGPASAPVTVVEVLDPACEGCRAFAPIVKQIQFLYSDDVRVVVRFAAFHPGSDEAVRLLEAARRQGKFDAVLTALFDGQPDWASHHAPNVERAWEIAASTGLDIPRARRDARDAKSDQVLRQDGEDVVAIKVDRTPTFFVNGRRLDPFGAEQLMSLVTEELGRSKGARP